jgi:hypothetical protein
LNASVFASERRTNRDQLAANVVRWNPALYADLEAGSGAEMPVMQNGALHAARARLGHPEGEHQR